MNLKYRGDSVLAWYRRGATLLALILSTSTHSESLALEPRGGDADDGGVHEWATSHSSVWNETKYWSLDKINPTEYFPEDEGFIRVGAPNSAPAPRPREPKTKSAPDSPKNSQKNEPEGVLRPARNILQVQQAEADSTGHLSRHVRHLLNVDDSVNFESQYVDEGNEWDSGVVTANDWLWSLGAEGSGEGSGFGNL